MHSTQTFDLDVHVLNLKIWFGFSSIKPEDLFWIFWYPIQRFGLDFLVSNLKIWFGFSGIKPEDYIDKENSSVLIIFTQSRNSS